MQHILLISQKKKDMMSGGVARTRWGRLLTFLLGKGERDPVAHEKRNLVWITDDSMHVKSVLQRFAVKRHSLSLSHKEFSFMVSTESGVGGSLYRCPPRSPGSKILLLSLLCFCSTYSHPGNKMQESGTSLLWVVALSFLFAYMKQSKSAP